MMLPLLVSRRFQVLFTPLTGVLFTFPSRYWFTIGRQVVFSLGRWSSRIPAGFHVPRGTWVSDPKRAIRFAYGTFTLYDVTFRSLRLRMTLVTFRQVRNPVRSDPVTPHMQRLRAYTYTVWASPVSLAATSGISIDLFSSGY
jgi:hypothetical protein